MLVSRNVFLPKLDVRHPGVTTGADVWGSSVFISKCQAAVTTLGRGALCALCFGWVECDSCSGDSCGGEVNVLLAGAKVPWFFLKRGGFSCQIAEAMQANVPRKSVDMVYVACRCLSWCPCRVSGEGCSLMAAFRLVSCSYGIRNAKMMKIIRSQVWPPAWLLADPWPVGGVSQACANSTRMRRQSWGDTRDVVLHCAGRVRRYALNILS